MKPWYRQVSLFLLAGSGLAGCGDFMPAPSLEVLLPEQWQQAPIVEPRASETPAPLMRDWWKSAHDPALEALIARIDQQNLSLEQARFRLQAARRTVGGSQYLPGVSATEAVQIEPYILPDPRRFTPNNKIGGIFRAGLDASWEVPLFGQYGAAKEQAAADVAYAAADLEAVRSSVVAEAIADYLSLRNAQARSAALNEMITHQQKIVALTRVKVTSGLVANSDRLRVEQALLSLQSEQAATQSSIAEYQQKLARLSGVTTVDPALFETRALPVFPPLNVSDSPLDVVRNRPDIRKAEQSVITAGNELKLAKSDRYPKLTLEGTLTRPLNIIGHPLLDSGLAPTLAQNLSLPLFDWGKRVAFAEQKDAKLAESASVYRATVVEAITEVEQMNAAYKAAQGQQQTSAETTARAQTLNDYAALLTHQGLSDEMSREDAAITAARARIDLTNAKANEGAALVTLTKALGGGVAKDTGDTVAKTNP